MSAPDRRRALTFGGAAERYERFRPGYPERLRDLVLGETRPGSAVEVGAGTGKATRLFAAAGVQVTAVEPDPLMCAVLARVTAGMAVTVLQSTLEELPVLSPVELLYSAAAWHWTDPATRWTRAARLLVPGGLFASFGGPITLVDEVLEDAVEREREEVIGSEDILGTEDDADDPDTLRWPGNELAGSPYFTEVAEHDLTAVERMAADDLVGLLSTVSAYLLLAEPVRDALLARIRALLPETVDVRRELTLHVARRTDSAVRQTGTSSTAPTA